MMPRSFRASLVRVGAFAFALVCVFAAQVRPVRALESRDLFELPPPSDQRSVSIEARLTGRNLDALVDGFGPGIGTFAPDAFGGATGGTSPWEPVPPPARWVHSMIYDPLRDRLVVFGGQSYEGSSNQVWAFYLSGIPRWVLLEPSGTLPSARAFHSAVYDSVGDRMIVFGGDDGTPQNDVWQLSFAGNPTWTRLNPTGVLPPGRKWHTAVLDRARNRMLVFGGMAGATTFSDVWALSLGTTPSWSQILPGGTPPARTAHAALYDAAGDRMLVFGGLDGGGSPRNDVWALALGTPAWAPLTVSGTAPSARFGVSALYDRARRRAVFFGGGTGAPNTSETWTLSLDAAPTWAQLSPAGPPQGRQFHTAAYDPFGDRMLIFGGSSGPILSDTWALPLAAGGAWVPLSGTRRRGHSAVLDTARDRMVVFGGESGTQLNDLWELGLGTPANWARLNPAATPPSPRALHSAIYDPRRDRMLVFGGRGGPASNEVWELTFSGTLAWRLVVPDGTPPAARFDHIAVYDPVRYRMIIFGGSDGSGTLSDTWALNLGGTPSWTQLSTSGPTPLARGGAQAIYDGVRDRILLHGGYNRSLVALADVWQLSLAGTPTWSQLSPSGVAPAPRLAGAAVYDAVRDRMLISGGTDLSVYFADTWALNLSTTVPSWTPVGGGGTQPAARSDHKAVYDSNGDRLFMFGGINPNGILHDAWELDFNATVDAGTPPPADGASAGRAVLLPASPNPARGGTRLGFTLPAGGRVTLAIFDLAGRRVRTLVDGAKPAGRHDVAWDGRDEGGAGVAPGVYFVELSAAGTRTGGKLVVIR